MSRADVAHFDFPWPFLSFILSPHSTQNHRLSTEGGNRLAMESEQMATEDSMSLSGQATEVPPEETVSIAEDIERHMPADYIILCVGYGGKRFRYKTHKSALMLGSEFFRNMFLTCEGKVGANEEKRTSIPGKLEELEMDERPDVIELLLQSLYAEASDKIKTNLTPEAGSIESYEHSS